MILVTIVLSILLVVVSLDVAAVLFNVCEAAALVSLEILGMTLVSYVLWRLYRLIFDKKKEADKIISITVMGGIVMLLISILLPLLVLVIGYALIVTAVAGAINLLLLIDACSDTTGGGKKAARKGSTSEPSQDVS